MFSGDREKGTLGTNYLITFNVQYSHHVEIIELIYNDWILYDWKIGRSLVNNIYCNIRISFPPDKDYEFYRGKKK